MLHPDGCGGCSVAGGTRIRNRNRHQDPESDFEFGTDTAKGTQTQKKHDLVHFWDAAIGPSSWSVGLTFSW